MVGIIVVWKRKRNERYAKQKGIFYSTNDDTMLQKTPANKLVADYYEVTDRQDSKEPAQYIEIFIDGHSTEQADKIVIQNNPAYSDTQFKMQDNPAYSATKM